MKKTYALLIAIALAVAVMASPMVEAAPQKVHDLSGHVVIGIDDAAVATLCVVGGYGCELSPSYTKLIVIRHEATTLLKAKDITKTHAVRVQQQANQARQLLDESWKVCQPSPHTEKCLGDQLAARKLLEQAKAVLSGIH